MGQGLLDVYAKSIQTVRLYGPTNMSEVVERVNTITRDFEAMIGEIVDTVSSASTELEASAGTLTATAERSQQLTTTRLAWL